MTPKQKTPKTKTRAKRGPNTPPAINAVRRSLPKPQPDVIVTPGDDGLTDRQRVFIDQYLQCWNATEAARRAGYKDVEVSGYENRQNATIRSAISARLAEYRLSADEVLARLSDMAMGDMGDFIGRVLADEDGHRLDVIDLEKARRAGKLHLIKRLSITDSGISIELYDAGKALQLLGKHYELFSDNKPEDRELTVTVKGYNEMLEKVYGDRARRRASGEG